VLHEGKYLEAVVTCRDRVHFLKSQHHEHLWYGLLLFMLYLNLPSTLFKYLKHDYDDFVDHHFFNCSLLIRIEIDSYLVPCLSTSTSQTFVIPSYLYIEDLPLSFCTKMFNLSFKKPSDSIRLSWSKPNYKECESKGNICRWKNTTSSTNKEIHCFPQNKKGNLLS
jgi:hypothetical protein